MADAVGERRQESDPWGHLHGSSELWVPVPSLAAGGRGRLQRQFVCRRCRRQRRQGASPRRHLRDIARSGIDGATGQAYTVAQADVGQTLTVVVSGDNPLATASASAPPTSSIASAQ